ncbi:hypothetical protein D9757_003624 [Collybiopsis confluens]|uniref:Uncharacterized protein n=1 Tax=Collybiopsis confluens TaxID=2823264 RepID=A0A8H5MDS1_9AGAR|nr:hypothetical protein D9757_003624 [Collybiopsis confluens]
MLFARMKALHAVVLVTATLVNVSFGAFDQCKDPLTNQTIRVTELCSKYSTPTNDVFAVGETVDGVCELFYYYRPGGPKTDKNCIPHGGVQTTSEAIFCKTASCAAYYNNPTCAGQATISGILPIQGPFLPGTPLPLLNIWGPLIGTTATCEPGINILPQQP